MRHKYSNSVHGENLKPAQKNALKLEGAEKKAPSPPRVEARTDLLRPNTSHTTHEPEK